MELSTADMVAQLEAMGIDAEGCETKQDCLARIVQFKAALDARDAGAPTQPPQPPEGVQGGRRVDDDGVNAGTLRCPRCATRLVSRKAALVAKCGGMPLAAPRPDGSWSEARYEWWWRLADHNDFDNVAMSHFQETPHGKQRFPLCPECGCGPLGVQTEGGGAEVLLSCECVTQQDLSLANDAADFAAPAGMPLASLQQLIAGGMASASFRVTFSEARLGLELQDVEEGQPGAVQVIGFPRADDGTRGPAELSGKIHLGDCVSRVNDTSCLGLDYRAVLDLIIGAARPVTLVFERPASGS